MTNFGTITRPRGKIERMRVKRADGTTIDLGSPEVLIPWRFWLYRLRCWFEYVTGKRS